MTVFYPYQFGVDVLSYDSWMTISKSVSRMSSALLLQDALADMAALQCTADCKLNEVWYCYGRDRAGLPTGLVRCPIGTLGSASCLTRGCTNISIPSY